MERSRLHRTFHEMVIEDKRPSSRQIKGVEACVRTDLAGWWKLIPIMKMTINCAHGFCYIWYNNKTSLNIQWNKFIKSQQQSGAYKTVMACLGSIPLYKHGLLRISHIQSYIIFKLQAM